eukprot:TRINITY_DN79_c0_g1_i1.p1 TRINITY_DN79_c0_g1~~TRINITY_DN79_c0_g1_i1.p1  ORF type:complete len:207 (+),score=50.68 TRINITY_DN79_c0_g1_i1:54-674(+)
MIVYSAIYQGNEMLAEYPERDYPKLAEVCKRIVGQVPMNEQRRKTFEEETYKFHYKSGNNRVFICVSLKATALRVCYRFLSGLEPLLEKDTVPPKRLLKEQMEFHNNPNNDQLSALQNEIDEVKDVMMENIDRVLQRGEKLDHLADQSNILASNAADFHRSARTLKRHFLMKNLKLTILIIVIVAVIIIIIVLVACNPNFSKCKSK